MNFIHIVHFSCFQLFHVLKWNYIWTFHTLWACFKLLYCLIIGSRFKFGFVIVCFNSNAYWKFLICDSFQVPNIRLCAIIASMHHMLCMVNIPINVFQFDVPRSESKSLKVSRFPVMNIFVQMSNQIRLHMEAPCTLKVVLTIKTPFLLGMVHSRVN